MVVPSRVSGALPYLDPYLEHIIADCTFRIHISLSNPYSNSLDGDQVEKCYAFELKDRIWDIISNIKDIPYFSGEIKELAS